MAGFIRLYRQEHRRQRIVAVARSFRRHSHKQRIRERGFGNDRQVDVGGSDGVTSQEPFGELTADGGGVALAERGFGNIEPGGINIVFHVPLLEVHLDRRVTELIDHLHGEPGAQFLARRQPTNHRHRARRGDFRERDDSQEQLHPLDPSWLDVAEHVAAQRGIQRAINAVVFFFLHREIRSQDLFHWVARRLRDFVVGREGHCLLHVARRPAKIGYAICRFGNADTFLGRNLV